MMDALKPHINTIVESLFGILALVLMAGIAALRRKIEIWLAAKATAQQRELLHMFAKEGVALVEAVYKSSGGERKLAEAYKYVTDKINSTGIITLDDDAIRAAIEKAVQEYKKGTGVDAIRQAE